MNQEFYDRGLEKAKQKDYAGAIEQFNQAIQLNPDWDAAYLQRGLAYYNSGAILQAVFDYDEAIKRDQENGKTYYFRALAKLTLKNLAGALEDVEKAIEQNFDDATAYDLRGIVYRKQGNIQDAIANFKKAAELYLAQKDKENARLCLEKIKQLQPKSVPDLNPNPEISQLTPIVSTEDYFMQLLDKAEQGDTNAAIADLNWILKVDPRDAQAYCCRGIVLCKIGNYREAIADFNQALRLDFQDPIIYRNRGKARSEIGDHQGGLADLNQALKMQSEDILVYIGRGNIYQAMANYLAAIQDYSQAIQIDPQHPLAYYNRGIAYTYLEEMSNAVADYQKAASIYCEQEDWQNYQLVFNSLQKIQSFIPKTNKATYNLLRQRLLRMVGGHWEIAQRLIQQKQDFYPGMSEEWYLQKVIDDLERDKR